MQHVSFFSSLSHAYILTLALALVSGLLFPEYSQFIFPYTTVLLSLIFFFAALKVNLREIIQASHDIKAIGPSVILMLVVFPILTYYTTKLFAPDLALPFLILAAMPTAMTAPLFTEIAHGKQTLSMVLSVITSTLAPFTIPLVIQLVAGTEVYVDIVAMFTKIALIIGVPVVSAELIKKCIPRIARNIRAIGKPGSLTALGLLLAGVVAIHSEKILETIITRPLQYIVPLCVFFFITHVVAYIFFFYLPYKKRIAATVSLAYMNFMLAIVISSQFFPSEEVLIPIIIASIPWSIAIIPFASLADHHEHS